MRRKKTALINRFLLRGDSDAQAELAKLKLTDLAELTFVLSEPLKASEIKDLKPIKENAKHIAIQTLITNTLLLKNDGFFLVKKSIIATLLDRHEEYIATHKKNANK